jgi:hypothetical protein
MSLFQQGEESGTANQENLLQFVQGDKSLGVALKYSFNLLVTKALVNLIHDSLFFPEIYHGSAAHFSTFIGSLFSFKQFTFKL